MKSGTITLAGRPNSGKSTLLNTIIGQKVSIVSDKPQTTRYGIRGILNDPRGQATFIDTPGIHKPLYQMNQRMQRLTAESLREVDLVLLLVDGSIAFGAGERFALELLMSAKPRALLLINKIDRFAKPRLLPIIQRYSTEYDFLEIIPVSAISGDNVGLVVDKVFEYLPEGEALFPSDQVTDRTERFMAAEFIREKILERVREELVYASAVLLKKYEETRRPGGSLVHLEADILVEKPSQQRIILGRGGLMLRGIGADARKDLEAYLGCRVYLGLRVRTVRRWRNDEYVLNELEIER